MKILFPAIAILLTAACQSSFAAKHNSSQSQIWKDPGVDVGVVKTATALFTQPDGASAKISALRPQDWTVLVSHQAQDGWLHVIGLASGRLGWVRADRVSVRYTRHPNKGVDLPSEQTGTDTPPILVVTNDSDRMLYLHFSDQPEMRVAAHSQQTVTTPLGVGAFNVSAANVIPLFGDKLFTAGSKYTWRFWIKTVVGGRKTSETTYADPKLKEEARRLLVEITQEAANLKVEKQILVAMEDTLRSQAAQIDADNADLKARKAALDDTDQSMIDAFNAKVDAYNEEHKAYAAAIVEHDNRATAYNTRLNTLNAKRDRLDKIAQKINAD